MHTLATRIATVRQRMEAACRRAHRSPQSVTLIAVSKTVPETAIAAAAAAGVRHFGESYAQEALPKIAAAPAGLVWHFIGPLQSNKTRPVAEHFDWVHGVDRLKIAERLAAQRPAGKAALQICVQVNLSGEASKSGCRPVDAPALCAAVAAVPGLQLRGLMAVPALVDEAEEVRPSFRALARLAAEIRAGGAVDAAQFDTLSMGMSEDFEIAIEEGATLIRVGSAIFGARHYGPEVTVGG